jgi:hypothetical protein
VWKAGDYIPLVLTSGEIIQAKWAGSARMENLAWWQRQPGNELTQIDTEVAGVAVRASDTKQIAWGDAPAGARLIFLVEAETISKEGKPYRLAKMVTVAATPEQEVYFHEDRFALFGNLRPDGTIEIIPPLKPPPPSSSPQGELF